MGAGRRNGSDWRHGQGRRWSWGQDVHRGTGTVTDGDRDGDGNRDDDWVRGEVTLSLPAVPIPRPFVPCVGLPPSGGVHRLQGPPALPGGTDPARLCHCLQLLQDRCVSMSPLYPLVSPPRPAKPVCPVCAHLHSLSPPVRVSHHIPDDCHPCPQALHVTMFPYLFPHTCPYVPTHVPTLLASHRHHMLVTHSLHVPLCPLCVPSCPPMSPQMTAAPASTTQTRLVGS